MAIAARVPSSGFVLGTLLVLSACAPTDVVMQNTRTCKYVDVVPDSPTVAVGDAVTLYGIPRDSFDRWLPYRTVAWEMVTAGLGGVTPSGLVTVGSSGTLVVKAMCTGENASSTNATVFGVLVPPTAIFSLHAVGQARGDGDSVRIQLPAGEVLNVELDASRSALPSGNVPALRWRNNGSQFSTQRRVITTMAPGLHSLSLIATDTRGLADTATLQLLVERNDAMTSVSLVDIQGPPDTLLRPGESTVLHARLRDSDGRLLADRSVAWRVNSSDSTILRPSVGQDVFFYAPVVSDTTTFVVTARAEGREDVHVLTVYPVDDRAMNVSFPDRPSATLSDGDTVVYTPRLVASVTLRFSPAVTRTDRRYLWYILVNDAPVRTATSLFPFTNQSTDVVVNTSHTPLATVDVIMRQFATSGFTLVAQSTATVLVRPSVPATPTITSISPSSPSAAASEQTLRVFGTNFRPGLILQLTSPNGTSATLSGSALQNVTELGFDARVFLPAIGTWALRVTNPDGLTSNSLQISVR